MNQSDRLEAFEAALAQSGVKRDEGGGDSLWGTAGLVLMVIGVVLGIAAAIDLVSVEYADTTGRLGVILAIVGGALHVRAMVTGVLRYWLLRLVYEQSIQTDRLLQGTPPVDSE